jgi:hypothetical protein
MFKAWLERIDLDFPPLGYAIQMHIARTRFVVLTEISRGCGFTYPKSLY